MTTWRERSSALEHLKTRLGTYLSRVREGRTVLVTDRGERKRTVTLPVRKSMIAFRPTQGRERALSEAIIEDRKDRV